MEMDNFKSSQASTNNSSLQVWNFVSVPTLHPMKVTVNVNKSGTASGLLFVAPYTSYEATMVGQTGAQPYYINSLSIRVK